MQAEGDKTTRDHAEHGSDLSQGFTPSIDEAALGRPTHARQYVIVFAVTLAIITYIDRVCISQAAPEIRRELGLSKEQMAWVFAAFSFAYSAFEIPGGWLGDWIGPRKVLMRVVAMWSIFTAATGWAWNLGSLIVFRFLFGAGEAGCFPNLTKAFTLWLPSSERVRAQGFMWLAARWGGAFTPLLVFWVFSIVSWRWGFVLFGAIGVVWAVFFYLWFRDDPREHAAVNPAELALIREGRKTELIGHGNVPWLRFLSSRTVWMLWLQYFCLSYPWYFYITWLPTYLQEQRGVSATQAAFLACFPLFFGGLGNLVSGVVARRLEASGTDPGQSRRMIASTGFFLAAALLVLSTWLKNPWLAMLAMGASSFSNDLTMPPSWAACMDVGGRYAGSLAGSMNMMGNFGGMMGPLVLSYLLMWTGDDWDFTFYVSGAVYVVGGVAWLLIDPITPLDYEDPDTVQSQLPA
ncbi:MAG: MFS transporter [Thermoguttaceae bacterium]